MLKTAIRPSFRIHAKSKLSNLRKLQEPSAEKLATAIDQALSNVKDTNETAWVDRIEQARRELNLSTTLIQKTDFGAGTADSTRSAETMDDGVAVELTVGDISRESSKSYIWALLLLKVVREFKPSVLIELGTSVGISGAYQASALKINNSGGNLVTLEGDKALAALAESNLHKLGLDNVTVVQGKFADSLADVLAKNGPVDYVFVDGHHDEKATLAYFAQIKPYLASKAIVIFDDISWSPGMRRAWQQIEQHEDVNLSANLEHIGICVMDKAIKQKQQVKIPMAHI